MDHIDLLCGSSIIKTTTVWVKAVQELTRIFLSFSKTELLVYIVKFWWGSNRLGSSLVGLQNYRWRLITSLVLSKEVYKYTNYLKSEKCQICSCGCYCSSAFFSWTLFCRAPLWPLFVRIMPLSLHNQGGFPLG